MQLRSYAKINWTLEVLFRRADGFHELKTIYQTVSLYDTLDIAETDGTIEVRCDDAQIPTDEKNLVFKAASALREATGVSKGARIEIAKRIPVAAGLGGGSSNAAMTLLALRKLWGVEVNEATLLSLAASLGSDVPLFLVGGTMLGVGRGEQVNPIDQLNCAHLLLVNPGFEVSTRDAYEGLSRLTSPETDSNIPLTLSAAKGISGLPLVAKNDLEKVVLASHPEIAEVKRRLLSLGASHAQMSGSGATVFGVFDNSQMIEHAESVVRAGGYWARQVRTVDVREYQSTIFQ